MHTHFGSATSTGNAFLSVLLLGSVWRIGWMHVLAAGHKRNNKHLQGFAKAALFQY